MSNVTPMIEAIFNEDFDTAREALKASLSAYMTGTTYVSNGDLFGNDYNHDYAAPRVTHPSSHKLSRQDNLLVIGDESAEVGNTLYAVYGDKVAGPIDNNIFNTLTDAEHFQYTLLSEYTWARYASSSSALFIDTYEE